MEQELKPCPFCGPGELQTFRIGSLHFVECIQCDSQRTGRSEAEAIAAWNTRPTQTADAVDDQEGHIADAVRDAAKMNGLGIISFDVSARIANHIVGHIAALSTSADSGDREGGEPVAWLFAGTSGVLFWTQESSQAEEWRRLGWKETPLYAHPPAPQDSGLADELYVILKDALGADTHGRVSQDLLKRTITALRQPRNDGELLREAQGCAYQAISDVRYLPIGDSAVRRIERYQKLANHIDAALARLEQGEG